jgi:hypothetical protein
VTILQNKGQISGSIAASSNVVAYAAAAVWPWLRYRCRLGGIIIMTLIMSEIKKISVLVGRVGFEPTTPAMSRLLIWCVKLLS